MNQTIDAPWEHCGVLACAMRAQCVQPHDCKSGQQHQMTITDPVPSDEVCTGMDVPSGAWTAEDAAFWTGTPRYQPWKDVVAFFNS